MALPKERKRRDVTVFEFFLRMADGNRHHAEGRPIGFENAQPGGFGPGSARGLKPARAATSTRLPSATFFGRGCPPHVHAAC